MKKAVSLFTTISVMTMLFACSKGDTSAESVNCYVCSTEAESIDVCEENGDFIVDGEVIENPNNASLEDYIEAIEANPNNDPNLEGIRCRKK